MSLVQRVSTGRPSHRRARWVLVMALMGMLAQAVPAQAHDIYTRRDIGQTGNFCMIGVSTLSHWTEGDTTYGWASAKIETRQANPTWAPCWQHLPNYVYQHAATGFAYYWDFSYGGSWQPCFGDDWSIRNNAWSSERDWIPNLATYGCGSTFYMFFAGVGARNSVDDGWVADWVLSGNCTRSSVCYHWYDQL